MKICIKSFLLLHFVLILFKTSGAQSVHGFRVGLGVGTTYYAAKKDVFIANVRYPGDAVFTKARNELVKYVDYTWQIHPAITIGLTASHNFFSLHNDNASPQAQTARFSQTTITFRTQYDWLRRTSFQLYSAANVGFGSIKQYEIHSYGGNGYIDEAHEAKYLTSAMHLNLLGISVGKKIGGFGELGIGFKGLISAGFFMRL